MVLPLLLSDSDATERTIQFARPGAQPKHRFEVSLVAFPRPLPVAATGEPSRSQTVAGQSRPAARFPSDVVRQENRRIQNTLRYPRLAIKMNWQGDVVVAANVGPGGGVQSVNVLGSSGHTVLDRAAVDAVQKHRFAPGQDSATIRLRFSFRLRTSQE